jgi:hypothetical protein
MHPEKEILKRKVVKVNDEMIYVLLVAIVVVALMLPLVLDLVL